MGNVPLRMCARDAAPPSACAPLVDRHAWPAHTERFTVTKPVTIPKVFHGCETYDGVHMHTQAARRAACSTHTRDLLAALPLCNSGDVQFGEPLCRGDDLRKICALCGRPIRPLDCCCCAMSGAVVCVGIVAPTDSSFMDLCNGSRSSFRGLRLAYVVSLVPWP
jgi:hypothetical protein